MFQTMIQHAASYVGLPDCPVCGTKIQLTDDCPKLEYKGKFFLHCPQCGRKTKERTYDAYGCSTPAYIRMMQDAVWEIKNGG